MKPFDFKYGRKQETVDKKEENVTLMEESEDEHFGSFQRELETVEMEELTYLESSMVDFLRNLFVLLDNIGGARMSLQNSSPITLNFELNMRNGKIHSKRLEG
ncbi:hypothetical protein AVEN_96989-1 [Araneus ventricosus]|uniref:Uncharacterized protein n=1 Tax=Araneus ventricosus TaxID=182803 RepID=A0A4Y2TL34_ARAVE|nr:hypothetical protein AVEN_75106-1 [Araneus ventricosus]GBO00164.1 hypothetical protein AVEN_96989-1 [Araneus ventricosus]